jgi:ABC-type branched-subunit amino acid transport system permease subunit
MHSPDLGTDLSRNSFVVGCLAFGGIGTMFGAILHVVVLIGGPEWIRFVGAPESVVRSAREGTWLAPVGALSIAALLAIWSLYAFSAAGWVRPLPLLRPVLGLIAVIFLIRGALILPFLGRANWSAPFDLFVVASSLFIFALGWAYAIGFWGRVQLP